MFGKWTRILTALLFTQQVLAMAANENGPSTEAAVTCQDCLNKGIYNTMDSIWKFKKNWEEITRTANYVEAIFSTERLSNNKPKYSLSCSKFVKNGEYTDLGNLIIREVHDKLNEKLYAGTPDLIKICPNYRVMSPAEKDGLWVLFATGWAQTESTCGEAISPHGGKNGNLAGILQMHQSQEHTYEYGKKCKKGDANKPSRSFICAISMLSGWIELRHGLFGNGSHWEVLRPNGPVHPGHEVNGYTEITDSMRLYSPCGAKLRMASAPHKKKKKHQVAKRNKPGSAKKISSSKRNSKKRVAQN